jgi:hypothetical protein
LSLIFNANTPMQLFILFIGANIFRILHVRETSAAVRTVGDEEGSERAGVRERSTGAIRPPSRAGRRQLRRW